MQHDRSPGNPTCTGCETNGLWPIAPSTISWNIAFAGSAPLPIGASMPIRPYLNGQKFDPELIRIMGVAFEMAAVAVRVNKRTDLTSDEIARKIIAHASAGERDPDRLCDFALQTISLSSDL